jgi:DNA-binding HxlR family transcriptional regulator
MKTLPDFRSGCPVASALDLVGDRWTLVVLRTIFAGRKRYGELAEMPERIASNILADRLGKLERYELITRRPYQNGPLRYEYELTEAGANMLPILQALAAWATRHLSERWASPGWFLNGQPEEFYPVKRQAVAKRRAASDTKM